MYVQWLHVQLGPADTGPGVENPDAPPRVGLGAAGKKTCNQLIDSDQYISYFGFPHILHCLGLDILCGLLAAATSYDFKTLLPLSLTPFTYGSTTMPLFCSLSFFFLMSFLGLTACI